MKTNIVVSVIALVALLVLNGCLKSPEATAPATPQTFVSVLYLAPTAPSADIYFDAEKVSNSAFPPNTVTPIYNALDKATFSIKFKKAGADSLVAEIPSTLYDSATYYTIFVYNSQVNGPANATRITDDFSDVLADQTKPYYRFFHSSPNAGTVDLYIDNVKIESDRRNADNIQFQTFNKFLATTTGFHTIQVKQAGTDIVLATGNNLQFLEGNAYTLYLKGLNGGTGSNELSIGILMAAD